MIIYGWRNSAQQLTMATFVCGNCGNPAAHALRRVVTKFTLFFIPLFPIRSRYFTVCTFCGATNRLTKEQAKQVQETQQPVQPQPAQPPQLQPQQAQPQQFQQPQQPFSNNN